MPNHVYNRVRFYTDPETKARIILDVMNDEDGPGSIDFEKLIPMPRELDITDGSMTDAGEKLYVMYLSRLADLGEDRDQDSAQTVRESVTKGDPVLEDRLDLGERAVRNRELYGHRSWYGWSIDNWGTKWNAYTLGEEPPDDGTIAFYTAWDAPLPVIEALSDRYSGVTMRLEYADEDVGSNVGRITYRAGSVVDKDIPDPGSARAYEMYADITGNDLSDLGLIFDRDAGNYVYRRGIGQEQAQSQDDGLQL